MHVISNCRRNSGAATAAAARHVASKRKAKADTHKMTGTLSRSLKSADKKCLRSLAARERTDDDTDNIYIYMYAYVSPRCWLGSGGDTHAKWRAPPVFVPGGPMR